MPEPKLFRDREGGFWEERADGKLMVAGGGMPWPREEVEEMFGPIVSVTLAQMAAMASPEALALECAARTSGPCWCGEHEGQR